MLKSWFSLRWLYLVLAWLSIGLAGLGVMLPGLPTTEFVLLAAYFASKSLPKLSRWLQQHRLFGPLLRDWQNGGVIRHKTKWFATGSMLLSFTLLCCTVQHWPSVLIMGLGMGAGAVWMWSRPTVAPSKKSAE